MWDLNLNPSKKCGKFVAVVFSFFTDTLQCEVEFMPLMDISIKIGLFCPRKILAILSSVCYVN